MTDREMLDLAAKAAGLWDTENNCIDIPWDPLNADGDALRLAVKLGLCVDVRIPTTEVWVCPPNDEQELVIERMSGDRVAATRRAIVRAAAEIGRAMP